METLQQVPLKELKPSPLNPRTSFDPEKMEELVASIGTSGILEPIIGRRVNGNVEVVAGARRHEAAKRAKLTSVPVIVRDLTDAQVLEAQLIENDQREDVNDLDRAAAIKKLMAQDKTYTAEKVAERLGRKPATVYLLLKLLRLVAEGQALLREGKIDAGHGVLIARLGDAEQAKVLKWLRGEAKHREGEMPAVREVKRYIEESVKVDLFSPLVAEEQPQVAKRLEELKAKGITPVLVTRRWTNEKGIKSFGEWREVGKKKCPHVEVGANAFGDQVELLDVCTTKKCKTHWPELHQQRREAARGAREKKESAAQREKRLAKEKREKDAKARDERLRGVLLKKVLAGVKAISKEVLRELVAGALMAAAGYSWKEELAEFGLDKLAAASTGKDLAKATDRQLAQLAAFAIVGERLDFDVKGVAKDWGVDLKKLDKQAQATAPPPAEKAATAKKKR